MDIHDIIQKRRSVRKFLDIPVEWDKISRMLETARLAPNSGNLQPWSFVIIKNKETIQKIADACLQQAWISTAPVIIVVAGDAERIKKHYGTRGEKLYLIQDCAIAAENMLLMAEDQELAACWVGAFDDDKIQEILDMPKNILPQAVIPLGYADEKPLIPSKFKVEDITFFETYGNKIRHTGLWPLEKHVGKLKGALEVYTQKAGKAVKDKLKKCS